MVVAEEQAQSVEDAEAKALVQVLSNLDEKQVAIVKKHFGISDGHRKKSSPQTRNLTEASRKAMQLGVDASHDDGFVPVFPADIEDACQRNPELREVFGEIWASGKPLTHALLEMNEELLQEYPVLFEAALNEAGEEQDFEKMSATAIQ